jgi:hypothetical protein
MKTYASTHCLLFGNKQIYCEAIFSYTYDEGVQYYNDGSGCPPTLDISLFGVFVSQLKLFDTVINRKWLDERGWGKLIDGIAAKYINTLLTDCDDFYSDICDKITNAS